MNEALLAGVAVVGVALGAFSGGVVGLGFPVIAVPAMALGYGLETAVVISAIPTLAIDFANLSKTRSERHTSAGIITFGIAAAILVLIGTLIRNSLNERVLIIVLASAIALYLISEFLPKMDLRALARKPATGAIAGAAAGLLQATVGVSGPIVGMYYLNRTDTRSAFIFHITVVFAVMGLVRTITLASLGAFTVQRVLISLGLAVFTVILRTIGFSVGERIDRDHFRKMVMAILALSLIPLLAKAL